MAMLISKFHRLIQSRLLWAAFLIIVVFTFVIWGTQVPGAKEAQEANAPGTLRGEPVSARTLAESRANTYLSVIMAVGRQIQITPEIDRQIRQAAWERIAALDEARRLGLNATDDEVFQAIQSHEGFQAGGQFNKAGYKQFIYQFLNQLGFTERQFESYIREEILLQKMRIVINRAVLISPNEIQRMFHSISDKFTIEYVKLGPELVEDEVKVTKEDARAFFEQDPTYFTIPEKVKVNYIRVAATPFLEQAAVADEDIEAYYEDNSDDFLNETNETELAEGTEETKETEGTNTSTEAAETAASPTETGAVETAEAPAETGGVETAEAPASTNFLDFGSLTNDTFTPLTDVKPKYKPLEEVKDEIRETLQKKLALDLAADKAMEFVATLATDREGNAPTFEAAAAQYNFLIEKAGPFHVRQKLAKVDAGLDFNETAFNLQPGPDSYVSYPVRGSNYVYVIALEDRIPERVPEFDEVADSVLPIAKEQALIDALSTKAKEVSDAGEAAAKEGGSFAETMAKYKLETTVTEEFTASSGIENDPDYSQILLRGIMTLNSGEVSELLPATDAILVAHVVQRSPGDPTTLESLKSQIVNSLRRQNGRFVYDAWQKDLLKQAVIKESEAPAEEVEEEPAADEQNPS
jgi:peptidyl-prolyl cis-trans isomerase D